LDDQAQALMLSTEGRHELGVLDGLGIEKVSFDLGGTP
jgi:hypothetical protein